MPLIAINHEITPNGNLALRVGPKEQEELKALREEYAADPEKNFDSDNTTYEVLEWLLCNSDFQWIRPEDIGALTEAPIIGIRAGDEDPEGHEPPIMAAWGFMDYQVRSLQEDLANNGVAYLQKGTE